MIQIQNRNKAPSICSEGQISNPANDQDSVTTLKYNQNQDQNKQIKVYQKQKEKNQAMLTQAAIRLLLHSDRFISNEKTYFKFPKMDFYLNIDCLFSSVSNKITADGSNISVINQFKKVKYTEISKKSNGIHIYMQKRECNEIPWQVMVNRMQTYGNQELSEISNQITDFCEQDFNKRDYSETSSDQSEDTSSASKIFGELSQKEEVDKIDEIFIQNKNKPMLMWRGINREFVSLHINECFLNYLQYTPEEFQMEVALSGIPEFVTSHNYNIWMKEILKVLTNLFSQNTSLTHESRTHRFTKEFITQNQQNVVVDFESYDIVIGNSDIVVEVGVEEVKPMKKKPKRKQEVTAAISAPAAENGHIEKTNNNCLKINEEKRKLTDEEKYFINNHYFKIQDFDFNKSKVCKYRFLSNDFKNKLQLQLHA